MAGARRGNLPPHTAFDRLVNDFPFTPTQCYSDFPRTFFEELRLERLVIVPNFHLTAEEQAAGP